MTEPVARATSPRRTVRVAVALVTGQALLCAVIGYVTFGPPEQVPQAAGPVDPLAGSLIGPTPRPPGLPPAPAASSTSPSPGPSRSARATETAATLAAATPSRKPSRSAAPAKTTDRTLLDPPPPPNPALTVPEPMLTPTPTSSPAVDGGTCDPEGAEERTSAGVELSCTRQPDGSLVWLIN